jgi:hypothetical protein
VKRLFLALLLMFCLLGPARAVEVGYGASPVQNMMATMWQFMEWFLGQQDPLLSRSVSPWHSGAPIADWYTPYTPATAPAWGSPWHGAESLEGVWQAPSGEYWLVRAERFLLDAGGGRLYRGTLRREGEFLRIQLPWGESEFAYQQRGDLLLLRDVEGRSTWLRRIVRGGWSW